MLSRIGCFVVTTFILTQPPAQAQQLELLEQAVKFAQAELQRQGVAESASVVFDIRRLRAADDLIPGESRFGEKWAPPIVDAMTNARGLTAGTLEAAQTCIPLSNARKTCHIRPYGAVVAVGAPRVRGSEAEVRVHLWFQLGAPRINPETGEPFEVIHAQTFDVHMTRNQDGWSVVGRTRR